MNEPKTTLYLLLIEDDPENLDLLIKTLPREINGMGLEWDPCGDFDEARKRLRRSRYDVVVTDIYRDRKGQSKGVNPGDDRAKDIVQEIRKLRFCPIVAFTDGSAPESFRSGPFVKLADKSKNGDIDSKLAEVLKTGIPELARKLHDELDRSGGSYLWGFLEERWNLLQPGSRVKPAVLERLVRRRAALQLGRLHIDSETHREVEHVEGLEYYVCPPIANDLRLGEILRHKNKRTVRVVLVPHCHLITQPGDACPRADHVLTLKTVPAQEVMKLATQKEPWHKDEGKRTAQLRRRTKLEAEVGRPAGRYCFLPGFLDIPDLYCDLLQVESIPFSDASTAFERVAVLDTPFSEALQSCFTRFYSNVGVPNLNIEGVVHLTDVIKAQSSQA